jgi:hypothetical protein
MRKLLGIGLLALLCSTQAGALNIAEEQIRLAQTGVTGADANGEPQTTVIDAQGNLKMVPADSVNKQQKKLPNKAPSQPVNQPNIKPDNIVPVEGSVVEDR